MEALWVTGLRYDQRHPRADNQHPFDQIADWIKACDSWEAYRAERRERGEGVRAAEEYRTAHPKLDSEFDEVLLDLGEHSFFIRSFSSIMQAT